MLKQTYRFHGHGSLRYLYQHGQTVRSHAVAVRSIRNARRVHNRATVVVARKVLKAAPKRNRVRRRIYEYLRLNWDHLKNPYDIAITVHDPSLYDLPPTELKKLLDDLLGKAQLWTESPKIDS